MIEPAERTVSFDVTVEDTLTAVRFVQRRSRLFLLLMTLAVTLSGVVLLFLGQPFGFASLIVGGIALGLRLTGIVERWAIQRQIRSVLGTSRECSIADDGLRYRSITATGVIPWSSVSEIIENRDVVVFYRDRIVVYVIPASAFGSSVEKSTFVSECRKRITAARGIAASAPLGI